MSPMRRAALATVLLAFLVSPGSIPAAEASGGRPAVGSRDDANLVAALVRSHLVALHQANISGNYSVLRDIGSGPFRAQFTAADLAAVFTPLRKQSIDLQSAAVLQPAITGEPTLDEQNVMHLSGTFPTSPAPVEFEFAFMVEGQVWKLAGLRVEPIQAVAELGVTRQLGYAVPTPRPR